MEKLLHAHKSLGRDIAETQPQTQVSRLDKKAVYTKVEIHVISGWVHFILQRLGHRSEHMQIHLAIIWPKKLLWALKEVSHTSTKKNFWFWKLEKL